MKELASGATPAGFHTAVWDGRDDAGRATPAGVYFAVLDGLAARATTRLVRLAR